MNTTSVRRTLTTVVVLAVGLASGTAARADAAPAPDLVQYAVSDGLSLRLVNDRVTIDDFFPVLPTAVANSHYFSPGAAGAAGQLSFKAVVGGVLTGYVVEAGGFDPQPEPKITTRQYGSGWGQFTQLVDAQRLYGLHPNGSLYRYTAVGTTAYKGAGSVAGFGSVRSMTLVHTDSRKDVLLMNLTGGSLYQVTVPVGSPMKAVVAPVRTRSWQSFEQLLTSPKQNGLVYLQGVDEDTGRSTVYDLGPVRGSATTIRTLGSPSTTPISEPRFASGSFEEFEYRGAP